MKIFGAEMWALWCGSGLMLLAALVNARTYMVPNRLSLPAAVAGWLAALLTSCSAGIPSAGGGVLASFAAAAVGLLLLVPFYAAGYIGGGCVKMQMAFGAWVGCALAPASATLLTALATVLAGAITAAAAVAKIRAAEARGADDARSHLLPAQVTLSLGSICGVVVPVAAGWV